MHRFVLTVISSGLLLITAACTGGVATDDGLEDALPTAAPTTIPTPTPAPSPTPEPTATSEPEPTPTPELEEDRAVEDDGGATDDQGAFDDDLIEDNDPFGFSDDQIFEDFHDDALAALLLSEEDLPAGWEVMLEGSLRRDVDVSQGVGDMMEGPCGKDSLDLGDMGEPVHVGKYFSATMFGPFFVQDLYQYDVPEQASDAFDLASSQLDCGEWIEREPLTGMDIRYNVEDLDFPELGDSIFAVTLSMELAMETQAGVQLIQQPAQMQDPFEEMSIELILVRSGSMLSQFVHMDIIGHGGLDLEETVTLAVSRIESAQ